MGRGAHRPEPATRRQVEALAGYGVPEAEIAGVVAIDPKTLRKHYRSELDHGHTEANARVAENLYRKATGEGRGAVTAAILWLKTRAGRKETSVTELSRKNHEPVNVIVRTFCEPPREIELVAPPMIEGRAVREKSKKAHGDAMTGYGVPEADIARVIGIAPQALSRWSLSFSYRPSPLRSSG